MSNNIYDLFNWVDSRKKGRVSREKSVVSIASRKYKNQCFGYCITFLKEDAINISKSERLTFAINNNKIYFIDSEKIESLCNKGFKMCPHSETSHFVRVSTSEDLSKFVGEYTLKYSDELDLYYIEKEEK